jgi:hypothetical protein
MVMRCYIKHACLLTEGHLVKFFFIFKNASSRPKPCRGGVFSTIPFCIYYFRLRIFYPSRYFRWLSSEELSATYKYCHRLYLQITIYFILKCGRRVVNPTVMACVMFPGKNLVVLFVLLHFLLLFCCHISQCALISVTRDETADVFSYSGVSTACDIFCKKKGSFYHEALPAQGICTCKCLYDSGTFIIAESKCISNRVVRNTSK